MGKYLVNINDKINSAELAEHIERETGIDSDVARRIADDLDRSDGEDGRVDANIATMIIDNFGDVAKNDEVVAGYFNKSSDGYKLKEEVEGALSRRLVVSHKFAGENIYSKQWFAEKMPASVRDKIYNGWQKEVAMPRGVFTSNLIRNARSAGVVLSESEMNRVRDLIETEGNGRILERGYSKNIADSVAVMLRTEMPDTASRLGKNGVDAVADAIARSFVNEQNAETISPPEDGKADEPLLASSGATQLASGTAVLGAVLIPPAEELASEVQELRIRLYELRSMLISSDSVASAVEVERQRLSDLSGTLSKLLDLKKPLTEEARTSLQTVRGVMAGISNSIVQIAKIEREGGGEEAIASHVADIKSGMTALNKGLVGFARTVRMGPATAVAGEAVAAVRSGVAGGTRFLGRSPASQVRILGRSAVSAAKSVPPAVRGLIPSVTTNVMNGVRQCVGDKLCMVAAAVIGSAVATVGYLAVRGNDSGEDGDE